MITVINTLALNFNDSNQSFLFPDLQQIPNSNPISTAALSRLARRKDKLPSRVRVITPRMGIAGVSHTRPALIKHGSHGTSATSTPVITRNAAYSLSRSSTPMVSLAAAFPSVITLAQWQPCSCGRISAMKRARSNRGVSDRGRFQQQYGYKKRQKIEKEAKGGWEKRKKLTPVLDVHRRQRVGSRDDNRRRHLSVQRSQARVRHVVDEIGAVVSARAAHFQFILTRHHRHFRVRRVHVHRPARLLSPPDRCARSVSTAMDADHSTRPLIRSEQRPAITVQTLGVRAATQLARFTRLPRQTQKSTLHTVYFVTYGVGCTSRFSSDRM